MPISVWIARPRLVAALLAAAVLPLVNAPARSHVVPIADMVRGIRITQAQCAELPSTVWIAALGQSFCFRYYLSTAGGEGSRPAVFLSGDKLGTFNMRTGAFALRPDEKDVNTDDLEKIARGLSRQTKTAAIYLGRVGLDGSSGDHRIRRSVLELKATQAALDAIKQRHRFEGFHLIGQSGGSALVGGLLALRTDIGCAAIGAGRLVHRKPVRPSADPAHEQFNVADAIPVIVRQSTARIMLVTDPADKYVPEQTQTPFVHMMRQAGKPVEQFIVQATDENNHFVSGYSRAVAADCIRGAPTQEIEQNVRTLVETRLALAKAKAEKAAAGASALVSTSAPIPSAPAPVNGQPSWTR